MSPVPFTAKAVMDSLPLEMTSVAVAVHVVAINVVVDVVGRPSSTSSSKKSTRRPHESNPGPLRAECRRYIATPHS